MKAGKECIIILGMHRSGTSVCAGLLNRIGYNLGSSIANEAFDNPRGFNENYKVQKFNDVLLDQIGAAWDDPFAIKEKWESQDKLEPFKHEALLLLKREFDNADRVVLKDPRFSFLIRFWEPVLEEVFDQIDYIFLVRHPDEIAASLLKRNQLTNEYSLNLIASYWLQILDFLNDHLFKMTYYDLLVESPEEEVNRLIPEYRKLEQKNLLEYIDPSLRHHKILGSQSGNHVAYNIYKTLRQERFSLAEMCLKIDKWNTDFNSSITQREYMKSIPFAKLFIDHGRGWNEADAIMLQHDGKQLLWDVTLDQYSNISQLMLQPNHAPCIIEVDKLLLKFSPVSTYEISDNSVSVQQDGYTFDQSYPRFIVSFKEPVDHVELNLAFRIRAYIKQSSYSQPNYNLLTALALLVKFPGRIFQHINAANWRTLRSAMKRESPSQIIRNFIKLIKRPEHQKYLEEVTRKNQAKVFNPGVQLERVTNELSIIDSKVDEEKLSLSLLYVTDLLPEYDTSSGGKRASNYLKLLNKRYKITIAVHGEIKKKYFDFFTLEKISISPYHEILHENLHYDSIVFAWYFTFLESTQLIDRYSTSYRIIDTVDVHWVRELRAFHTGEFTNKDRILSNKKRELRAYTSVDALWAVSEEDKVVILEEIPEAQIHLIPNIHELIDRPYEETEKHRILFFGGFNHHPNVEAALQLVYEILPRVREEIQEIELIIAGSNAPQEIIELGDHVNVVFLGFIEENDVQSLYSQCKLCVAPLYSGAGMKGKITEAINYMCPVITTSIGNEGINLVHEEGILIGDSNPELSQLIIQSIQGRYDLSSISLKAKSHLVDLLDVNRTTATLYESVIRPVDICIVTWNGLDLLKQCIASILSKTHHPNYRIIVYSNGCTDGTLDYLNSLDKDYNHIQIKISEKNDGYVEPCNAMMQVSDYRDVLLLNNDTMVTAGWLLALQKASYHSADIGISGSKILYPDERLQEFGSIIYEDGSGMNYGKNEIENDPEYMSRKFVPYVSGCAMYIKRSTIEMIGVFDASFSPCYFEDSDYCYRAWKNGIRVQVIPESIVYHLEGGTVGRDVSRGFKKYQEENKVKFLTKHKAGLKKLNKSIFKMKKPFYNQTVPTLK